MSADSDAIFAAASQLSDIERLVLATRLLESIPDTAEALSMDDEQLLEKLASRRPDDAGSVSWDEIRDRF